VGSYLAVQVPENLERVWDWDEWVCQPPSGQMASKADPTKLRVRRLSRKGGSGLAERKTG
jgi:hypothetical protein